MKLNQLGSSLIDVGCIRKNLLIERIPNEVTMFFEYFNLTTLRFSRGLRAYWRLNGSDGGSDRGDGMREVTRNAKAFGEQE